MEKMLANKFFFGHNNHEYNYKSDYQIINITKN